MKFQFVGTAIMKMAAYSAAMTLRKQAVRSNQLSVYFDETATLYPTTPSRT
jgi:hypothetical protein